MFAHVVHDFLRDLVKSYDMEIPPPDPAVLQAGLRDMAREEPDLEPLILGCLDSEGLHYENLDTALKASFHPLDEALNELFDLMSTESIAYPAAYGFSSSGAGSQALFSWMRQLGMKTSRL